MATGQDVVNVWAKLVARAWADPGFKSQLVADPSAILKQEGIDIPAAFKIKVDDGGKTAMCTLPLPPKPAGVSADRLAAHAAADVTLCSSCCCCP